MISKNTIAYIRSLHNKSTRLSESVFLVEGRKCMGEFMDSDFEIVEGFFSDEFATQQEYNFPYQTVTVSELARISTLSSNGDGILIVRMKQNSIMGQIPRTSEGQKKDTLILVLDRINDPGNLGTIIRIADWYGVSQIICSPDTVDCYNPKVLMATMGSFTRVSIWYTDLVEYLSTVSQASVIPDSSRDPAQSESTESGFLRRQEGQLQQTGQTPIYGAYLDGESTHTKDWRTGGGYLVIGSEAHGISNNLEKYITDKVTIPRFGPAESLNAGVATAVILDRMRG